MTKFARRRIRNTAITLVILTGVWLLVRAQARNLGSPAFTTGYLLLSAIACLALYNLRKKLPFLPVGSSTAWLQLHIYVGIGSVGLFALHAGTSWPNGIVESLLAAVYLLTVTSGVVGLYFTRTFPAQLARVGLEVIYERIPVLRREVGLRAGSVVLEAVENSAATTLADFYTARLYAFFHRPRGPGYLVRPTTARRRSLMREMQDLRRYLTDQEQPACERLFSLVRRKDDLDFHEARQKLLKLWLFGHIALTYVLLSLALLHGLLAHAFHGGAA
jgi:hypothetical protein